MALVAVPTRLLVVPVLVTGEMPVKEGQVIELVAAAGGVAYLISEPGVHSKAIWQTRPATGGKGYGNGGDVNEQAVPADAKARVDANWPGASDMKRYLYGGSGGGSSALIIDGTPLQLQVAVAVRVSVPSPVPTTCPRVTSTTTPRQSTLPPPA